MTTQSTVSDAVRQSVAEVSKHPVEEVTPDARLMEDLGIRSFGRVELAVVLEDRIGVAFTDDQVMRFKTVGDVIAAAEPR